MGNTLPDNASKVAMPDWPAFTLARSDSVTVRLRRTAFGVLRTIGAVVALAPAMSPTAMLSAATVPSYGAMSFAPSRFFCAGATES